MQESKGQMDHFIQKKVAFLANTASSFFCLFLCIPHLIWTLLEGSEMGLLFHVMC